MKVKHLEYWNNSFVSVDGKIHGPMDTKDAEMATRRGGNVTKEQMTSFLKAARIPAR